MGSKRKWTDEELIVAVKDNLSYAGTMVQLGLKPAGGNYSSIKRKISELNLESINIPVILVTCETSHLLISPLKSEL